MSNDTPRTALQLRSLVKRDGTLQVSLLDVAVPRPGSNEVLIRVEGAPINPSDLGLLLGPADMSTAAVSGTGSQTVVTARIPDAAMKGLAARIDVSMPVGNEGTGLVVEAGSSAEAQALRGKRVAALGGGMYAQYRTLACDQCLVLPDGTTPAEGASAFINPLTALGMIETMRREQHTALVHTPAASNLGQMLNRLCIAERVGLVNVVRRQDQADLLTRIGAKHVCVTESATFMQDLTDAIAVTGATMAFDAIGGGSLGGQILSAMEAALSRSATEYSRYGSTIHKQLYIYGGLDTRPTEIVRNFGMAWSIGGWLLFPFLQKIGASAAQSLKQRVASELKTTFASHYAREVSLIEALQLDTIAIYNKRATGEKFLITPNQDLEATRLR